MAPVKGRPMSKMGALSYAKLMSLLSDGGYTLYELAEQTGLHYLTVCEYTRALYNEKVVHIAGWAPDSRGRFAARVYKLGKEKDAKKTKMTSVERSARYRQKIKAQQMSMVHAGLGRFQTQKNNRLKFIPNEATNGRATDATGAEDRSAPAGEQTAKGADSQHQHSAGKEGGGKLRILLQAA